MYELKIASRNSKYHILLTTYSIIISIMALIIMLLLNFNYRMQGELNIRNVIQIFPKICYILLIMISIMIPAMTAATISGERERQTLDIMLTTRLTTKQIVTGKLFSGIVMIMPFVMVTIPILALSLVYGGINWINLVWLVIVLFVHSVLFGSISICCSVIARKTIVAIVLAYVCEILVVVMPVVMVEVLISLAQMLQYYNESNQGVEKWLKLLLIANPMYSYEQFLDCCIGNAGVEKIMDGTGQLIKSLVRYGWVPINLVLEGITSWFLVELAAKKLNPLIRRKKARK